MMRVIAFTLLGVLACRELPDGPERVFEESFEDRCDGVPCGWSQSAGPDAAVRSVETFHPGEHGIELRGDGTTVLSPMGEVAPAVLMFGSLEANLSARCTDASLAIEVGLIDDATGISDTFRGRVSPPGDFARSITALIGDRALVDGGLSGGIGGGAFEVRVNTVLLRLEGDGECVVDHLIIDDVNASVGPRPGPGAGC
ncbi:MAG: hypothetical protein AAGE52_04200 [Myxococcota bacterium]